MRESAKKVWWILQPLLIYYLVYFTAYLLFDACLAEGCQRGSEALQELLQRHQEAAAGVIGGLSMLAAVLPLYRSLKGELLDREKKGAAEERGRQSAAAGITLLLAVTSSLGLNILLSLSGLIENAESYQEVAESQYGVPVLLGVILYGVISPLAEEILFRGILFNRLRREFSLGVSILLSALLFGFYHGNYVQGIYGTLLGMLMAYLYAADGHFRTPMLFHSAANLTVYLLAQEKGIHEQLFCLPVGVGLLAITAAGVIFVHLKWGKDAPRKEA